MVLPYKFHVSILGLRVLGFSVLGPRVWPFGNMKAGPRLHSAAKSFHTWRKILHEGQDDLSTVSTHQLPLRGSM